MSKVPLNFACGLYDRVLPLYTGDVTASGIDLNFVAIDWPRQIFDRMGWDREFDACEFSSSEYITRAAGGRSPFVAIPVFVSRVFRHGHITINRRSGIKTAKDLEGRRVGVTLYTQTAAVFIRGLLQHEYGVDLSKIHWVEGGMEAAAAHGDPEPLAVARPVSLEINRSGKSLSRLLQDGEIDALVAAGVPKAMRNDPDLVRLFPNFRTLEQEYYERTRIFPIMHLIAMRRDFHERYPFVATSLYHALCASKELALSRMHQEGTLPYMLPWMASDVEELDRIFGSDSWPYGIEPNRPTLEALVSYMAEQGLIARTIPLEELFVPVHGHRAVEEGY